MKRKLTSKITFEIAKERLEDRDDIQLCLDGFIGWKKKSKFWDNIEKDYFWSIPADVAKLKIVHPNRRMKKKIETNLKNWGVENPTQSKKIKEKTKKTNIKKYGKEHYLQTEDKKEKTKRTNIKKYGVEHHMKSNQSKEKYKKTNIEKHGVENPQQNEEIKKKTNNTIKKRYGADNLSQVPLFQEKKKQTSFKNWGVEQPLSSEVVRDKGKETFKKRYGVEHQMHIEDVKNKIKQTCIKRYNTPYPISLKSNRDKGKLILKTKYGVDSAFNIPSIRSKIKNKNIEKYGTEWPFQSKIIKNKIKNTCVKKYGVEFALQSCFVREKIKQTYIKNYGVEHHNLLKKRKVKETDEWVMDWLREYSEPKPSYSTVVQKFSGRREISIEELEEYIAIYRSSKTDLERTAEVLFESNHYNKKPEQIKNVYRPDFKLGPRIFVNVDGLYWHSEYQKEKWYHFNLRKEFEENNLRIFQFREDEIRDKSKIVKSIINNALGKTLNKIFARKCTIGKVSQKDAISFLNKNHLMGSTNARHVGLYYETNLVSILSWKCRKNICKIERFCSKIDYSIVGGFSKLINHLEKFLDKNIKQIHNWVDLRYGTGNHLENKYFKLTKETLGWKWTNGEITYNRLKCRANMDERGLSEQKHANELGWYKIYDAGQRLYIKDIKEK